MEDPLTVQRKSLYRICSKINYSMSHIASIHAFCVIRHKRNQMTSMWESDILHQDTSVIIKWPQRKFHKQSQNPALIFKTVWNTCFASKFIILICIRNKFYNIIIFHYQWKSGKKHFDCNGFERCFLEVYIHGNCFSAEVHLFWWECNVIFKKSFKNIHIFN